MSSDRLSKLFPHLGFVLVYVIWGINLTSMKIGGREWDPLVFNGLRFASMIPLLWVYTYFYYRSRTIKLHIASRDLILICGLGILNAVGMEALLQYALQFSNSANGAVLGRGFMPVITVVIALLARQVKLTWHIFVGIPLALFSVIGMNRLVLRYPLPLLISLEMTAGALSLLPFVLWRADAAYFAAISATGWMCLIYTSLLATALGFSIHNWSLARLGPFKSSAYGYLLPVTAAIAGYFILHESISLNQCIGGAGVLTAMYLLQRDRTQTVKKTALNRQTAPL